MNSWKWGGRTLAIVWFLAATADPAAADACKRAVDHADGELGVVEAYERRPDATKAGAARRLRVVAAAVNTAKVTCRDDPGWLGYLDALGEFVEGVRSGRLR